MRAALSALGVRRLRSNSSTMLHRRRQVVGARHQGLVALPGDESLAINRLVWGGCGRGSRTHMGLRGAFLTRPTSSPMISNETQ